MRTAKQERERAERYRRRCSVLLRALEGCLTCNREWTGGLEEIYEFIRAERLVERYRKWAGREFLGIEYSRFAMENYNAEVRKRQEESKQDRLRLQKEHDKKGHETPQENCPDCMTLLGIERDKKLIATLFARIKDNTNKVNPKPKRPKKKRCPLGDGCEDRD